MKVKLGEVSVLINGDRGKNYPSQADILSDGDIPFVNAGHLDGRSIRLDEMSYITFEKYNQLSSGKFRKGDILYCLRGSLGKKAVVQEIVEGAIASSLVIIRPDSQIIDANYLILALDSPCIQNQLLKANNGSSQPNLSAASVRAYEIDLPNKKVQEEIVNKFDKIQRVIDARKQQLQKLDELVKARFVEMFGDRNYPHTALINLIKDGMGLSYGIVQPGDDGTGEMGVLRPVDMADGKISMASIKYIDRSIGDGFRKTELTGDELLITVRGTTGVTALTDIRFAGMNVTRGIAVIRYDREKINPVYLNAYLNTDESQRYIQEHTRGATLQQINLSDLRVQEVVVPPTNLQNCFAAFVAEVDKSKFRIQKTLSTSRKLWTMDQIDAIMNMDFSTQRSL